MSIKIIKSTRSYEDIKAVCNFMEINDNHNMEIYMGENINVDFRKIYGYEVNITGGLFVEPDESKGYLARIFIEGENICILIHELLHYLFYKNCNENGKNKCVLKFISEYVAKFNEIKIKLTFLKQFFSEESVIKEAIDTMTEMDKFMDNKVDGKNIDKQIEYMSRIATLLAWKQILIMLNKYNKNFDLIRDIGHFSDNVFGNIDWQNINSELEQYKRVDSEYKKYVEEHYDLIIK